MRQINPIIPENTFALTDAEIETIHAMAYYFASAGAEEAGITKQAHSLVCRMEEQFSDLSIRTKKDFKVWV